MNYKVLALGLATGVSAMLFTSCQKDEVTTTGGTYNPVAPKTVTLSEQQQRTVETAVSRVPKLRLYNSVQNKFIDINVGSRDFVFADPDNGFSFTDPDQNGMMVYADGDVTYFVYDVGIGVAGQGGGGIVVAGNTALNMDYTVCVSLEEVANGDGMTDLFDTGFGWSEFGAVIGISGDFNALADADYNSNDFDPFDYLHGYAAYYVLSDDLSGSHDVFDWLEATGEEDYDDFATSFVMDFQNMSLYFATDGTVNVSGGMMTFNGEYLAIEDLFLDFFDDDADPSFSVVSGYGSMGCN